MTYNRIEKGHRRIRLEELSGLCAVVGCSVGDLVEDKDLASTLETAARALLGRPPGS